MNGAENDALLERARMKLRNALGLAMKAGRLASGELAAEKALRSGAGLALVDENASANTKKQWNDACAFRGARLLIVPQLGAAIGKSARMIAVVTDENFSRMILSAAEECERQGAGAARSEQSEQSEQSERTEGGVHEQTEENAQ